MASKDRSSEEVADEAVGTPEGADVIVDVGREILAAALDVILNEAAEVVGLGTEEDEVVGLGMRPAPIAADTE